MRQRLLSILPFALAALLLAALLLGACSPSPEATPTPTRTPQPTALPATPKPAPSNTPTLPPTPVPTATTASTPTAVPTALNINPLTGLEVADAAVLERIPLAIKISNFPAANVRPLSGINSADVVFEHIAEGGVTRLTGVYLSQDADPIGSVRSGRIIDKEVMRMFHAVFACSGLSPGNVTDFRALPEFAEGRIFSPSFGDWSPMFYRLENGQVAPHNEFTDTPALWAEATRRGINSRQTIRAWAFDPAVPAGGQPAAMLQANYKALDSRAEWRYDAAAGLWKRWQGGVLFSDRLTGQQTTAANVLVVYAIHIDTLIQEDASGAKSVEIQLWGDGDAILFRDGQAYRVRWHREDPSYLFSITAADGRTVPLKPGNTWVQMAYASATETTAVNADTWTVETAKAP